MMNWLIAFVGICLLSPFVLAAVLCLTHLALTVLEGVARIVFFPVTRHVGRDEP